MSTDTIKRGALAGMAGGVVMAMWSMIALWADGTGFWTPLNLIAHTLWRGAPLDGSFSGAALVLGMVIHLMMSMMLGAVLAVSLAQVGALRQNLMTRLATGMGIGLVVWLVMQYGIWPLVDADAAPEFTPWVFALGHAMYGIATAWTLTRISATGSRRATLGAAA